MKNWCRIGIVLGCAAGLAATEPEKVEVQTIKEAFLKLPPVGRRILVDFDRWTPDQALATPAGEQIKRIVLRDADAVLTMTPCKRIKTGKRMLGVSRQVLSRLNTLAMAWKITGDDRYARRGIEEMVAVSQFSDWNPAHFLDVGEMGTAVAIGAACFDPLMTPEERKLVADALWEKAVLMSIPDHPDGQKLTPDARPLLWWLGGKNNWVPVCHAGVVAAALIAGDRDPDLAAMVIQRAIRKTPLSMRASYSPNGAYPEGPGYWGYGSEFTSILLGLLQHAFGTDYGLSEIPGWSTTGQYVAAVIGPTGMAYNYSDGGSGMSPTLPWFYLESKYPGSLPLNEGHLDFLKRAADRPPREKELRSDRLLPLALLWLKPENEKPPVRPLWYYSGDESTMPLVLFRTDWSPNAVFCGIKGGGPKAPHGHMDGGSFIIESEGVRWLVDLGMEPYYGIEKRGMTLWDSKQESDRWKIFRIDSDSHNIVRINGEPLLVNGWGTVKKLRTEPGKPMKATFDLASLYHRLESFERTAELSPAGVRIGDAIEGLKPGDKVRFQFCTRAAAEIGDKAVILRENGKAMKVAVDLPGARWQTAEAKTWMHEWDSDNGTARMVWFEIEAPESGNVAYTVDFIPGNVAGIEAK